MAELKAKTVANALTWNADTVLFVSSTKLVDNKPVTVSHSFKINRPDAFHAKLLETSATYLKLDMYIDKIDLVDEQGNVHVFDTKVVFANERQSNRASRDRFAYKQAIFEENREAVRDLYRNVYHHEPNADDIRVLAHEILAAADIIAG